MSVSWADKLELSIRPFDLEDLVAEIRKPRPEREALEAAARALELVQDLLEEL